MKLNNVLSSVGVFGAAMVAAMTITSTAEAQTRGNGGWTAPRTAKNFREFDRDRDGYVDSFEYRRTISQRFARWMGKVDRDCDGYLMGRERALARRTSPVSWRGDLVRRQRIPLWQLWSKHMDRARDDFRRLDRNRDGYITRREFQRSKRYGRRHRDDRIDRYKAVPVRIDRQR